MVCVHLESSSNPGLTLHSALGFAVLVWYVYVQFLSVSPAVEHVSVYRQLVIDCRALRTQGHRTFAKAFLLLFRTVI